MLTADDLSQMSAALARARAGAAEAHQLADVGWLTSGWADLIGAESSIPTSNAASAARLLASLEGRYARLAADPSAGDAERADFIRACGAAADNRESAAAADLLALSTAAGDIAAGAAADLRAGAGEALKVGTGIIIGALALALVVLIIKEGR